MLSSAQVYTATNYYYNNFDGGQLGSGISQIGTSAALAVSSNGANNLSVENGYCLTTTGNNVPGAYQFSFLSNNTNLNDETFGWEWTFIYKNSSNTADQSDVINAGQNSWKYWALSTGNFANPNTGYYLTQDGNNLSLRWRYDNDPWGNRYNNLISFDMSSLGAGWENKTYAIRLQRLKRQGQYVWHLFVDEYTSTVREAKTERGGTGAYHSTLGNYTATNSGLHINATSANRFKFDELKMYSMKFEIVGANDPVYGISSPLYNGQKDAVIYGLKMMSRGLFDINYLVLDASVSPSSKGLNDIIENLRIFKSNDSYFGNADDALVSSMNVEWRAARVDPFPQKSRMFTVGAADGSMLPAAYYCIKADVKSNAPTDATFSFTNLNKVGGEDSQLNYKNTSGVVNSSTASPTIPNGNIYDWVGASGSWSTLSNWKLANGSNPSVLPGPSDLVRIGNGQLNAAPTLSVNTKVGNLMITGTTGNTPSVTIDGGATLTVAGTFKNDRNSTFSGTGTLAVEGNWNTSGGAIDLANGNIAVSFSGAKDQSIKDEGSNAGNGVVFKNVYFSGASIKTLEGVGKFSIAANGSITMAANTTLIASGNLTLKADASSSAYVAAIPSSAAIKGQVTVERYVQGGDKGMWRTYRMFSSPVYDNTTNFINADVEGNRTYSFAQFIDDMIVSGAGGSANGFDQTPNNQASAWTYNNKYIEIPNINTSVNIGRGAYLFYRGGRSNFNAKITAPFVNPESIVMTYKGILNQQNVTVPLIHGSTGYSLVGNPYAAVVDWSKVTKTANIGAVVRVWNPSRRQYSTYNGADGVNGGSKFIAPGQSFFVQTTNSSSPSITFTEASKVVAGTSTSNMSRVMSVGNTNLEVTSLSSGQTNTVLIEEEEPARIRVQLVRNETENTDETLVVLKNGGEATFSGNDVTRMGGESVFLSSQSTDARELAINYMPHISNVEKVALTVNADNGGAYTLKFILTDIPAGYVVRLKDKYLNTLTDIANEGTTYLLNIDKSNTASLGNNRFELQVTPPSTLPVTFTEFAGVKTNEGVVLTWKTSSEVNNSHFSLQRAGENQVFTSIGTVPANQTGIYNLLDKSPLAGNNYYKLVQVDKDGTPTPYQKLVVVKYDLNANASYDMLIYPTVIETNFTLKYAGSLNSDRYTLKIADVTGKELYNKEVAKNEMMNGYTGALSDASSGVYFAMLIDAKGKKIAAAKLIKK